MGPQNKSESSMRGLTLLMHCKTPSLGSLTDFLSLLTSIILDELTNRTNAARRIICFINRYELLLNPKIISSKCIINSCLTPFLWVEFEKKVFGLVARTYINLLSVLNKLNIINDRNKTNKPRVVGHKLEERAQEIGH